MEMCYKCYEMFLLFCYKHFINTSFSTFSDARYKHYLYLASENVENIIYKHYLLIFRNVLLQWRNAFENALHLEK